MKTKKLWSIVLTLALLASLIVVPTAASAADVEKSEPIPTTPGSTLTSRKYVVSSDITITGDACQSALVVKSGAQVTITINEGCTLTVTGGDASGIYGAGAGIEVPEGSSLTIIGTGTLKATGGKAANGEPGQGGDEGLIVVDDPAHDEDDWCYSGKGGNGGAGGGGAGAGIGGRGGNGGAGGKGGAGLSYEAEREAYSGQNGGMGITGNRGSDCGDITVAKTVTLNAVGGGVSGIASAGGGNGFSDTHGWTNWYCAWGGGGGGAGGNGYAGAGIGSGGSGGTGGGGGGSGIIDFWGDRDKVGLCEGTGLGGEGGYGSTDGLKGKDCGPTNNTNHYVFAGDGGRTGVNGFNGMEKQDVTYLPAVAIPSAKELIYNGQEQTGVSAGENYTISGNSGTNAGTYTATATLKDGYCWEDGTLDNKKVEWTIAKQKVTVPEFRCFDYTGRRMTVYTDAELYTVTNGKATEIGTHTAVFTLRDSQNYEWADSKYHGETNYEIHLFTDEDYNGKCDICEEYNTIYISSAAELLTVWLNEKMSIGPDPKRGLFSGKTLKLLSDITCDVKFDVFSGTFDGNGHTIEMQESTLFTEINNATIKNLTVSGKTSHGGIVTTATNSNIINCVNRSETQDAGIVNTAYGCTVTDCINYGTIYTHSSKSTVYERSAGIVLGAYGCKISNCINFGTVNAERGTGIRASAGIADIIGSAIEISNCATLGIIESCNYRCGILTLINTGAVFKASNIFVGGYLRDTSGAPHDQNNKEASMCLQSYSENISFNNIFLSENYRNIGDSTPWAILQKATYIDGSDLSKVAETLNVEANKHLDWYKWTVKDGALALVEPDCIYHAEKAADCNGGHLSYYEKDGKYYATGEFDSIIEDIDVWLKTPAKDGGGYLLPVHIDKDGNKHCDICEYDVLATDCNITYLNKIINDDHTITTKEAKLDRARMIGEEDTVWGTEKYDGTTWYVLDQNVTLQNRPKVKGKVAIVLKNGCTLTANKGITLEDSHSLAIYAQSDDKNTTGELNIAVTEKNGIKGITAIGGDKGLNNTVSTTDGDGGAGGTLYFYGGNVSLEASGVACVGGGTGGNDSIGGAGGDGGRGGTTYFYGGDILIKTSGGSCIGGGNGGNNGDGGAGGTTYFYGGNVSLKASDGPCIGGGNGGGRIQGGDLGKIGKSGTVSFYGGKTTFESSGGGCISGGYYGYGISLSDNYWNVFGSPVIKAGENEQTSVEITEYGGEKYLSVFYKPETYTIAESAEISGNAYFDTEFKPTKDTKVIMDVSVNGGMEYWFGVWDNDYNKNAFALGNDIDYGGVYAGYGNQGDTDQSGAVANGRHTLALDKNKVYVDGVERSSIQHSYSSDGFPIRNTLYLFAQNRCGTALRPDGQKITFHSCKIYDGKTLKHYYVPASGDITGKTVIYDAVNDEYLNYSGKGTVTSCGTGSLENILNLTVDSNAFTVTPYGKDAGRGTVIVALYDNEYLTRLLEVKVFDLATQTPTDTFNQNGFVKAMWWSDLDDITPLCSAVDGKITE